MRVETSFCGVKQVARQDSGHHRSIIVQQPFRDIERFIENVIEVSIHPLEVRNWATIKAKARSPSPACILVEISFWGNKQVARHDSHVEQAIFQPVEKGSRLDERETSNLSNSSSSVIELPAITDFLYEKASDSSVQLDGSCRPR